MFLNRKTDRGGTTRAHNYYLANCTQPGVHTVTASELGEASQQPSGKSIGKCADSLMRAASVSCFGTVRQTFFAPVSHEITLSILKVTHANPVSFELLPTLGLSKS